MSSRSSFIKKLIRYRESARSWREAHGQPSAGFVTLYRGKAFGWSRNLDRPGDFKPGCYAISAAGLNAAIYQATGGDDMQGADEWSAVFNPAPVAA